MQTSRRNALVLAALPMAGVLAFATPASTQPMALESTGAHRAGGPTYDCDNATTVYGPISGIDHHTWTQVTVQFCLNSDANDNVYPEMKYSGCNYYWFAAWYGASQKYTCNINFHWKITHNGQVFDQSTVSAWGDTEDGFVKGPALPCSGSGIYTMEASVLVEGPYWLPEDKSASDTVNANIDCDNPAPKGHPSRGPKATGPAGGH